MTLDRLSRWFASTLNNYDIFIKIQLHHNYNYVKWVLSIVSVKLEHFQKHRYINVRPKSDTWHKRSILDECFIGKLANSLLLFPHSEKQKTHSSHQDSLTNFAD